MKKIYISYDYNNNPTGLLLSDSLEKAHIAWAGMKVTVDHVEEIDPSDESLGVHGVAFILTSTEMSQIGYCGKEKIIKFKRGL
jgi:hypothetical protein